MMKKIFLLLFAVLVLGSFSLFSGCFDDATKPSASFHIEPPAITINETVYMNSTSTDEDGYIVNHTWFSDDAIIGYETNITYRFLEYGTHLIKLQVVDDQGNSAFFETSLLIVNMSSLDEKLYGLWEWSTVNQTGNWTFYQNHTLEATFTGIGGASVTDWWKWQFNNSQLCFFEPSDTFFDAACYGFEFLDDYKTLIVTYAGASATWKKVIGL